MFVVTGASSGIGRGLTKALVSSGEAVLGVARRADVLAELEQEQGPLLQTLAADLSTPEGIDKLAKACSESNQLSGIVHSAGSLIGLDSYANLDTEKLLSDMHIHVATPIKINQVLASKLKSAWIIYIDSYSAQEPRNGWAGYSIVKSAAQMAARCIANEWTDSKVVRVFPGAVETPLVAAVLQSSEDSPTRKTFRQFVADGKLADPDVIGTYITRIVLEASDEQLATRDGWDYNKPEDRFAKDGAHRRKSSE